MLFILSIIAWQACTASALLHLLQQQETSGCDCGDV